MRSLLAVAAAVALVAPLAAAAADAPAPAPKVVRQLIYEVAYSAHTTHEVKSSGLNSGYGGGTGMSGDTSGSGVASGSGTASQFTNADDHGRLTIQVIAVTQDGGLVVDVSFAGVKNAQPATRVAVYSDGRLAADPAHPLVPEAARVLPLIARGFIAERDVSTGSSWNIPAPAPAKGSTTYRVQSSNGSRALIAIEGVLSMPGATGFDESDHGTTTYATDLVSPVSYELTARIRRQINMDQSMTTNAHIIATLVSDTFANK